MMTPLDPFNLDLEKITLIEASAGTGKTYTITTLVARLIAQGYAMESILVVTFTEAAAAELKLRIRGRLSKCLAADWPGTPDPIDMIGEIDTIDATGKIDETGDIGETAVDELVHFFTAQPDPGLIRRRLAHAVTCFDQACIMTIHSFCFQTLKENAFESGAYFDMELLTDSASFFDQVCMDYFMTRINDLDPLMLKFLAQKGVTPDTFKSGFRQVVTRSGIDIIPQEAEFKEVSDAYRRITRKIHELLKSEKEAVIGLIQANKGVDKRSYTKKNLPNWLALSLGMLERQGRDALFAMAEKGDPLYKFTRSRLAAKTKDGLPPDHEFFDLCEQLLELSGVMETNVVSLKLAFFTYFRRELEQMKGTQGACFFDDLINDLASALEGEGWESLRSAVTKKYKACLIDEFQDTDPAQYLIFSKLFTEPGSGRPDPGHPNVDPYVDPNVDSDADSNADSDVGKSDSAGFSMPDGHEQQMPFFMIGDPKQAIYAFRGGDIFAYLSACKASDQIFTLEKNYRSAPLMVDAVNDLFSLEDHPFLFEQIEFTRVHTPPTAVNRLVEEGSPVPPLQFSFVKREGRGLDRQGYIKKEDGLNKIPGLLATEILSVLNSGKQLLEGGGINPGSARKISPGDMAVLVRTNGQAEAVHQALADVNIPSYLSKTGSVFDSREAVELYDILAAVYEPDHVGRLKAALVSSVFGFSGKMLAELDLDEKQLWRHQDQFRRFKDLWEQKGFVSMIMALFHSHDGRLKGSSGLGERGLTNFYHLMELLSQAAQQKYLSMFYLLKWLREQLFASTRNEGADELRLESDKKAVAIVTIHKSKGLEYPIVFLPYLWAGGGKLSDPILFHDPDRNYQLRLDLRASDSAQGIDRDQNSGLDSDPDLDQARELMSFEQMAEEKRLLYVALTRASAMCQIFWAGISSVDGSALGSLLHPGGCKTDEVMLADLKTLCQQGEERVAVSLLPLEGSASAAYIPNDSPNIDLSARSRKRLVQPAWRISSFSALTRTEYEPGVYEPSIYEPGTREQKVAGGIGGSNREIRLSQFPKGAGSGDFFHAIFETLDFTDAGSVEGVVDKNLVKFGFKDKTLREPALAAVRDILATELATDSERSLNRGDDTGVNCFSLQEITMGQRFTELEFFFDVDVLDLNELGALFAGEPDGKAYAKKLFKLGNAPFKGFIKGFIDLVILHQGKWYIIDYKSNFLGTTHGDYDRTAMTEAMESHHYTLQYHLYLVALHRYLGMRLKNYSYDRDFGGVFYLFIRGMHPDQGADGVFFHRPSKEFLSVLESTLKL